MTGGLVANSVKESQNIIQDFTTNHYAMFRFSINQIVTRRYYERRIRHFLDFIEFNSEDDIEKCCNAFAVKANHDIKWITIILNLY